jgi:hypothetical protein
MLVLTDKLKISIPTYIYSHNGLYEVSLVPITCLVFTALTLQIGKWMVEISIEIWCLGQLSLSQVVSFLRLL